MFRGSLSLLAAASFLNLSTSALAMGIGGLSVQSSMGEPLRARIAVTLDDDLSPDIGCFKLVGPSSHSKALSGARLELVSIGGQKYVSIVARNAVDDPIVDITLLADGCGATLQKDFVALLSPKQINAALPGEVSTTTPSAATRMATPAAPGTPSATKPSRRHHRTHAATRTVRKAAASSGTARFAATPARPGSFMLRLDYSFVSLNQFADKIARERQLAQDVRPPVQAAQAGAGQATSVGNAPAAAAEHRDRLVLQPTDQDAGSAAAAGAAQAGGVAANGVRPGGATVAASAGGKSGLSGGPSPSGEANRSGMPWTSVLTPFNLLMLTALLLLAFLVAWRIRRRAPRSRFLDADEHELNTLMPADPDEPTHHPLLSKNLPPIDEVFAEPPAAKSLLAESYSPRPRQQGVAHEDTTMPFEPRMGTVSDFTVEQFDSTEHVMELAEVMLAFGRSSQAIDTLRQFIRNNTSQSIEPWLKLLDLYYSTDSRDEFESLADELHKHFNVVIASWAEYGTMTGKSPDHGSITLEALPHIMDRLTSSWGSPECLAYLDKLLADNRGGQRQGFSLALVRDILLLRDVLRNHSAPSA